MGLRSPQEMQQTRIRPMEATRFQAGQAPQLSKDFLEVADKALTNAEKQRLERVKEQLATAEADFSNKLEEELVAASTKVVNTQGLNVADKRKEQEEWLRQKMSMHLDNVREEYRNLPTIQRAMADRLSRFRRTTIPHELTQAKKVEDEIFKTYAANAVNEAVLENSGDPNEFNISGLPKVIISVQERARRRFGDNKELIDSAVKAGTSEAIRRGIEVQAGTGRLDNAETLLNQYKKDMLPADLIKSYKLIGDARKTGETREVINTANEALRISQGDLTLAERYVNATAKGFKDYREAMAIVNQKHRVFKEQQDLNEMKVRSQINQALRNRQDPMQFVLQLPPEKQSKAIEEINNTRGGYAILTDFKAVDELSQKLRDAEVGGALPNDILDSYRLRISAQNMKPLESWFNRIKGTEGDEARRLDHVYSRIVDTEIKSYAKSVKMYDVERGKLELLARDEAERLRFLNPKMSQLEFAAKIRKTLRERGRAEVEKPRYFWGIKVGTKKVPGAPETLAPEGSQLGDVHKSWIDSIKKGRPDYSEQQVMEIIRLLNLRGTDTSRPKQ